METIHKPEFQRGTWYVVIVVVHVVILDPQAAAILTRAQPFIVIFIVMTMIFLVLVQSHRDVVTMIITISKSASVITPYTV